MKETVIQFGEGVFLRGFVDYFLHKLNEKGLYSGKAVVVQPIEKGKVDILNRQDGRYNLFLRGITGGKVENEHTTVTSISRGINPYSDFNRFLELASNPDFRVIVSNTTEAGIEFVETDKLTDRPPKSFPAKLTVLLYERYKNKLKGFIFLPCELIDNNADNLKKCVLQYARLWKLEKGFMDWIEKENHFCNTLVDRITTGYPADEAGELIKQIGYEDELIDTAEIFHLWVIEGDFESELPFQKAGFNVVWTKDATPYKKRKVRILNGAHTSMVAVAYLYGLETVREALLDEKVHSFIKNCIFDEILPTLGDTDTDKDFANAVLERFSNPFIKHMLLSIALNSVSKFKVRVLPSILEYKKLKGAYPKFLTFSLASLIAFYKTDKANDGADICAFMKDSNVSDILANKALWDVDLSDILPDVEKYFKEIFDKGMKAVLPCIL